MFSPKLYAFADEASKDVDGQIAAMLRNNLNGLEIRGVDGINVSQITIEKAKEVRRKLDDNGLVTWSIGSPIGKIQITEDFAPHLDTFRHTLEVADILGAKNLRMFSFFMPKNEDPAKYRQQVLDRLAQLVEIAQGTGITLCHENEKGIYGDTADHCLDIFQQLPQIKGIFDPANFVQSGEDTVDAWDKLKSHIRYLHIKDSLHSGEVVPAGMGDGNVPFIVKEFLAQGGNAMTLEPHLTVFDGLKDLEAPDDKSIVGTKFSFPNADVAFDTACNALKDILGGI